MTDRHTRSQISAAQVFEFTEYVSLVRTIRADEASQLAEHLAEAQGVQQPHYEPATLTFWGPLLDDADDESEPEAEVELGDEKRDEEKTEYTRWPLDVGDVVVPSWRMDDEVLSYARSIAPRNPLHAPTPPSPTKEGETPTEDDVQAQVRDLEIQNEALQPIPAMVANLVGYIIDLVAVHTPPQGDGQQNRRKPGNWEHVLNVLSGALHGRDSSPVNPQILESARTRLEDLYGPAKRELRFMDLPIQKKPRRFAQQLAFTEEFAHNFLTPSQIDDGFLDVPLPLSELQQKRKVLAAAEEAAGINSKKRIIGHPGARRSSKGHAPSSGSESEDSVG
ncbi:hypothetical protein D9611_009301 [Ephemerocybe angulata]|uniref:Uncharacterized protein n=1 Tax=Ephemerocybe angulata TaxID=980116 RepID=A0A8H5BGH6_9AGAR|nr:hypothetical protein D9611_009301 [Tulosesus angulatus]